MRKNPIESVLTALPVIMLVGGLIFYYSSEKKQRNGALMMEQSIQISGGYNGISEQGAKVDSQRILWVQTADRLRGGRITQLQALQLASSDLKKGQQLMVSMAPRVAGSNTRWVYRAERIATGESAEPELLLELSED